jgi:uncharacterized protein (TIGR03083 family)
MADLSEIVDDLRAESDALDALVAPLAEERWAAPTPAAGWTIAHQIGHLLWTDRGALVAVTDEAAFADVVKTAVNDPIRPPSCSPTGGSPAPGCTMRC